MKLSFKYLLHDIVMLTGALPGLIWFRPRVLYESKKAKRKIKGGALLASNHAGVRDPVYLMFGVWYRRHRFVAMKELFEHSKFTEFLFRKVFLCISVDRENFSLASFKEIVGALKGGELVTIFPEGHVNESGFGEFKSGVALMAKKSGCPIIPIYTKRRKNVFKRLTFVIGEPIYVDELMERLNTKNLDDVTAYVLEKEKELERICMEKCGEVKPV